MYETEGRNRLNELAPSMAQAHSAKEIHDFNHLLTRFKTATDIQALDEQQKTILSFLPYTAKMIGFDQKNHAHQYDLWDHCLHTTLNLPRNMDDDMLYLAALLHDIGKPDCQCHGKREDDPNMHYYGHPKRSMEIVRDDIIPMLIEKGVNLTADDQRRLLYYVEYHDDWISLRPKHLRRHMRMASLDEFKNLMWLQIADAQAHVMLPIIEERIRICSIWAGEYSNEVYRNLLNDGILQSPQ